MDLGNCKSHKCRAEIRWARTENGKAIPLDREAIGREKAHAEPRGVFSIDDRGVACPWYPGNVADVELYRAHWATCNDKEAFRR